MIVQRSFFEINDSQNLKMDFPWPFDPKTRPTCRSKQTLTLFFCDLHLNKVPLKKDMHIMKVQSATVNKISMSGRKLRIAKVISGNSLWVFPKELWEIKHVFYLAL